MKHTLLAILAVFSASASADTEILVFRDLESPAARFSFYRTKRSQVSVVAETRGQARLLRANGELSRTRLPVRRVPLRSARRDRVHAVVHGARLSVRGSLLPRLPRHPGLVDVRARLL